VAESSKQKDEGPGYTEVSAGKRWTMDEMKAGRKIKEISS